MWYVELREQSKTEGPTINQIFEETRKILWFPCLLRALWPNLLVLQIRWLMCFPYSLALYTNAYLVFLFGIKEGKNFKEI